MRAGDNSVHESWLTPSAQKCFDLAVSYYGGTPGRFADRADHYSARTGPKLPRVADWLDDNWEWVSGFDFVAIPDDDLSASAGVWSTVFDVMDRHRLDLAQPSFGRDSNWCHPITAERPGSSFRVTNFIENGLAVFSARALEWCAPTLRLGSSGVGSDYAWAAIVRANGGRVGIVDEVHVEHVRAHHGAGATTHQSADSLASVLTHPEMYDELLLMATFGIANPYDPFVEEAVCVDGSNRVDGSDGVDGSERRRRDDAAPTTQGTDPGPLGSPLSFVVVGSGTVAGVRATVDSLSRRAVADDEIIVVDATFDSHLSGCLGADGGSVRLVSAPDRGLAECYDLAIAAAAHPTAVVVASGWTLGPAFRPSLAAATSRGPNDLVIDGFAPVAAIGRELVAALGGMGALSRAVTTGFGKVGTREMLETAERLAGAAGKRVVVGSLDASVVTTAEEPAIPAPPFSAGVGGQPPTRRLHGALLRAVHPTAVDAVLAVGRLVSDDQAMQYALAGGDEVAPMERDIAPRPGDVVGRAGRGGLRRAVPGVGARACPGPSGDGRPGRFPPGHVRSSGGDAGGRGGGGGRRDDGRRPRRGRARLGQCARARGRGGDDGDGPSGPDGGRWGPTDLRTGGGHGPSRPSRQSGRSS